MALGMLLGVLGREGPVAWLLVWLLGLLCPGRRRLPAVLLLLVLVVVLLLWHLRAEAGTPQCRTAVSCCTQAWPTLNWWES
jgi:hypothetical protein